MNLTRYAGNPILSPNAANYWDDLAVFNPGAWYDEEAGEVKLLYRAAESHPEYKCYFGLATSRDGYSLFGFVITIMFLKGILVSMAGPTPGCGIQHVLFTRTPREAALENWWMSIVQLVPRFLTITGVAVLGVVYFSLEINRLVSDGITRTGGASFDFEQVLAATSVIKKYTSYGRLGPGQMYMTEGGDAPAVSD